MRLSFETLSEGRRFPISQTVAKHILRTVIPSDLQPRFTRVHFGCNAHTTQEARIVGRGNNYQIRVNFWLEGSSSRVLAATDEWLGPVRRLGGVLSSSRDRIDWPGQSAGHYAAFLLAHEIAHVIYARDLGLDHLGAASNGRAEEYWCDQWAEKAASELMLEDY